MPRGLAADGAKVRGRPIAGQRAGVGPYRRTKLSGLGHTPTETKTETETETKTETETETDRQTDKQRNTTKHNTI
eukprot:14737275-Alexandrium_andersonii.AAC.1